MTDNAKQLSFHSHLRADGQSGGERIYYTNAERVYVGRTPAASGAFAHADSGSLIRPVGAARAVPRISDVHSFFGGNADDDFTAGGTDVLPFSESVPCEYPFHSVRREHQHKRNGNFGIIVRLALGLALTVCAALSPCWLTVEGLRPAAEKLALLSAAMQLPAPADSSDGLFSQRLLSSSDIVVTPADVQTQAVAAIEPEAVPPQTADAEQPDESSSDERPDSALPVVEKTLTGGNLVSGKVRVKNSTSYDISIDDVLAEKPDCKIKLNAGYQVLIIHTHTTECYAEADSGWYDPQYSPRTTDKSANVVAVGDVITRRLEDAGIRTLHVTTIHDYPEYNGSYDRAAATIAGYLKKYPSIEMVIDVHRDAMTQDDGTKIKPTVTLDGKKAAQVMIITGCDAGGRLDFPQWRKNLRMAMRLQRQVAENHADLMRPLYFAPYRYNMHLTPNSLLLEFGTDVNTLDEALHSADIVGAELAKVLGECVV